jgi:hypothetical protein
LAAEAERSLGCKSGSSAVAKRWQVLSIGVWLVSIGLWAANETFQLSPDLKIIVGYFGFASGFLVYASIADAKGQTKLAGCGLQLVSCVALVSILFFARLAFASIFAPGSLVANIWEASWKWLALFGMCFGPPTVLIALWRGIRGDSDERERASL